MEYYWWILLCVGWFICSVFSYLLLKKDIEGITTEWTNFDRLMCLFLSCFGLPILVGLWLKNLASGWLPVFLKWLDKKANW